MEASEEFGNRQYIKALEMIRPCTSVDSDQTISLRLLGFFPADLTQ